MIAVVLQHVVRDVNSFSYHEYLTASEIAKVVGETINQTKKDRKKTRDLKIELGI